MSKDLLNYSPMNQSSSIEEDEDSIKERIYNELDQNGFNIPSIMMQEQTEGGMSTPGNPVAKLYTQYFLHKNPDYDPELLTNKTAREISDLSVGISQKKESLSRASSQNMSQMPIEQIESLSRASSQNMSQMPIEQIESTPIPAPIEAPIVPENPQLPKNNIPAPIEPIQNDTQIDPPVSKLSAYEQLIQTYKDESSRRDEEIEDAKRRRFGHDLIGAFTTLGENIALAPVGGKASGTGAAIAKRGEDDLAAVRKESKHRLDVLKEQLNILKEKSNSTYLLSKSTLKGTANDPNSKESIEYAKSLGKLYPDLAPSFKGQPKEILQKYANQFVGRVPTVFEKEKLEASQNLRNKELAGRQGRSKDHQKMAAIKRIEDKADLLSGLKGVRSNYAQNEKRLILAEDGMRIIESVKKGKFLPTKQVGEELATVLASTLQGGNAASQGMVKNLIPETLWGDFKGAKQYLMNKPQSSISHDFLDQFEKQLAGQYDFYKEKNAVIKKQAEESLKPYFDKYPDLKESFNAQTALDIRNQYENDISSGTYPINRGVDPAIDKYAKEHGFDYDKAKKLLTQRGYKPKE